MAEESERKPSALIKLQTWLKIALLSVLTATNIYFY